MVRESTEPVVRDFLTREGTFREAAAAGPATAERISR